MSTSDYKKAAKELRELRHWFWEEELRRCGRYPAYFASQYADIKF